MMKMKNEKKMMNDALNISFPFFYLKIFLCFSFFYFYREKIFLPYIYWSYYSYPQNFVSKRFKKEKEKDKTFSNFSSSLNSESVKGSPFKLIPEGGFFSSNISSTIIYL